MKIADHLVRVELDHECHGARRLARPRLLVAEPQTAQPRGAAATTAAEQADRKPRCLVVRHRGMAVIDPHFLSGTIDSGNVGPAKRLDDLCLRRGADLQVHLHHAVRQRVRIILRRSPCWNRRHKCRSQNDCSNHRSPRNIPRLSLLFVREKEVPEAIDRKLIYCNEAKSEDSQI
ncbi:hypothetical protein SPHINGOT1_110164 [Sphingomonas sp. T1]|nr:hypothetical protein SPHINGOT1_110164 [Sphingomonas sp. T1]